MRRVQGGGSLLGFSQMLSGIALRGGETAMARESDRSNLAREHMSWAHRLATFWLVLCLGVFGGAYGLAEIGGLAPEGRPLLFIMLGTIIVTNAVWQAAALALARLESLILPRARIIATVSA
jgi:hypothetical protein